jgi:hypothetical protein
VKIEIFGIFIDGYERCNVFHRPAMPDPSTPCGQTTTETTVRPFYGSPANSDRLLPLDVLRLLIRPLQKHEAASKLKVDAMIRQTLNG